MKGHTKLNRLKLKYIIKDVLILLLALVVSAFAVYKNGLEDTCLKLLTLIFYGAVGFIGFYVIYFLVVTIAKILGAISLKKRKKLLESIKTFEIANEKFNYDYKLSLEENFKRYFEVFINTLSSVATRCGFKGKYLYLNFTFIDALEFYNNTLDILESKIDYLLTLPIIKNFNLQDKPIAVLEKTLNNLIEKEVKKQEKPSLKSIIFGKTLTVGIKFFFKDKIDEELNRVVNYVSAEWCLIYTKNNKKLLKKLAKKGTENVKGLVVV